MAMQGVARAQPGRDGEREKDCHADVFMDGEEYARADAPERAEDSCTEYCAIGT